jgi:hypothetical protein
VGFASGSSAKKYEEQYKFNNGLYFMHISHLIPAKIPRYMRKFSKWLPHIWKWVMMWKTLYGYIWNVINIGMIHHTHTYQQLASEHKQYVLKKMGHHMWLHNWSFLINRN